MLHYATPQLDLLKEKIVNTTDTSAMKPMNPGIGGVALNTSQQNIQNNKLPLHINGVCNSNEKITLDEKDTCTKSLHQYTKPLRKIKFNPDVAFNKPITGVVKKLYDMGEF